MEKIIYNTKLKKIIIAILIVMLVLNYIMPCTVNFVFAATYERKMFWPSGPNGTRVAPENLPEASSKTWNYETWKLSEALYQINNGGLNGTGDVDLNSPILDWVTENNDNDMDYDTTSISAAVEAHNASLLESYNSNQATSNESEKITLADALNKAIDEAVASRKQKRRRS